uniref:Uncharacterized protein n=1 Tax=Spongospora subterranea TaxID=70186 RepID=A0A0H5QM31_9EUKA|eukprot:CRZ02421.1 hypothetical protein [Spongospora subterranea]
MGSNGVNLMNIQQRLACLIVRFREHFFIQSSSFLFVGHCQSQTSCGITYRMSFCSFRPCSWACTVLRQETWTKEHEAPMALTTLSDSLIGLFLLVVRFGL